MCCSFGSEGLDVTDVHLKSNSFHLFSLKLSCVQSVSNSISAEQIVAATPLQSSETCLCMKYKEEKKT